MAVIGVADLRDLCVRHLRVFGSGQDIALAVFHGTDAGRPCGGIVHVRKPAF